MPQFRFLLRLPELCHWTPVPPMTQLINGIAKRGTRDTWVVLLSSIVKHSARTTVALSIGHF